MLRMLLAVVVAVGVNQTVETFRVSTAPLADVHQDALHASSPDAKQTTEVFPGTYTSPYGAAVITRIEALMGRLDEADRNALTASKARAGFDRSITSWRAHPAGRTVAMAVRYYREPLSRLQLEVTDDYGRVDPVNPARFEFFTIAVCSRGADAWKCEEEQLPTVAANLKVPLPPDRAGWPAAAEKLLEMVLAGK